MFLSNPISNFLNTVDPYDDIITYERTGLGIALNWLRILGTGLALIMITWMSIRYFMAHGPQAKMELKKSFTNYVIGAVVFIGASNLIYYIMVFVNSIANDIVT